MKNYVSRNLNKLKEEILSKSLYDFGRYLILTLVAAFLTSPFYINFSFSESLSISIKLSIVKIISLITIAFALAFFTAYLYFNKRFVLIKKDLITDSLTLLPNDRALAEELPEAILIAKKENTPLTLIIMDVDNFGLFNNEYSQQVGDEVLKRLSPIIKSDIRNTDSIYRQHVKGDEFLIIARKTNIYQARIAAERKREDIHTSPIRIDGLNNLVSISVCCGLAQLNENDTVETFLSRAYDAMKIAKSKPNKNSTEIIVS